MKILIQRRGSCPSHVKSEMRPLVIGTLFIEYTKKTIEMQNTFLVAAEHIFSRGGAKTLLKLLGEGGHGPPRPP